MDGWMDGYVVSGKYVSQLTAVTATYYEYELSLLHYINLYCN